MTDRPHPRRPTRGFTPEAIAHTKHRYEDTDEPQDCIAADLGVHAKTLDRLAKREGKLRKDRAPRDLPEALRLEMAAREGGRLSAASPSPASSGLGRFDFRRSFAVFSEQLLQLAGSDHH